MGGQAGGVVGRNGQRPGERIGLVEAWSWGPGEREIQEVEPKDSLRLSARVSRVHGMSLDGEGPPWGLGSPDRRCFIDGKQLLVKFQTTQWLFSTC